MRRTITIDDDAYKLLASLKRDARDSFTKVILRHIYRPAETCGELMASGQRLGENDNWIAVFCLYYREPVISLDQAFDRVPRLRRIPY